MLFTVIYFMRYQVLEFVNNLSLAIGNSRVEFVDHHCSFYYNCKYKRGIYLDFCALFLIFSYKEMMQSSITQGTQILDSVIRRNFFDFFFL